MKFSLKDPQNFFRNMLISFGFIIISSWIGTYVTLWLEKLFVINRTFPTSTAIGNYFFIFCRSLPNIIFYFFMGLTIPYVINESAFGWSIFIGSLVLLNKILTTKIFWAIEPKFFDIFSSWFPTWIILPSCILGTLVFLEFKNLKRRRR